MRRHKKKKKKKRVHSQGATIVDRPRHNGGHGELSRATI